MKILYLGHYREDTPLGESSQRFIQGLLLNNEYNIALRPLYLYSNRNKQLNTYSELETKSFDKYDCVIQHTLPTMLSYNKNLGKNIAVVNLQTVNIDYSNTACYLELMDKVYVRSKYSLNKLNIDTDVSIIHEPFDTQEIKDKPKGAFKFFAQGNLESRYNIEKIICAFLSEFNHENDAQLILNILDDDRNISKLIEKINRQLRIRHNINNKIVVFSNRLASDQETELLSTIHCAINIDKADGDAVFTLKNLSYGNMIIAPKNSASADFTNALLIDSFLTNVDHIDYHDNSSHSIYEQWYDVNMDALRSAMREAFMTTTPTNLNTSKFSYQEFQDSLQL